MNNWVFLMNFISQVIISHFVHEKELNLLFAFTESAAYSQLLWTRIFEVKRVIFSLQNFGPKKIIYLLIDALYFKQARKQATFRKKTSKFRAFQAWENIYRYSHCKWLSWLKKTITSRWKNRNIVRNPLLWSCIWTL